MEILLGLVVILTLVTVVGHGIWSLLAIIFRGGGPKQPVPMVESTRRCGRCRRPMDLDELACPRCMPETALAEESQLRIVESEARRLWELELLDNSARIAIEAAIESRRNQLHPEERFKSVSATRPEQRPPPMPVLPLEAEPEAEPEAEANAEVDEERPGDVTLGEADAGIASEAEETGKASIGDQAVPLPAAARRTPISAPPLPPPPPAKPLTEILASFMEQRNIRWGELVGGLMIVGCSAALVASFWAQITDRPLLQFTVFTAVTGAFFGLGLYTGHYWKLPSTSRGILRIATLLVPLNFLAFAAFSRGGPRLNLIAIVGETVAAVLFGWLLRLAARVIAPRWPMLFTAGILGLSLASLGVRYALPETGSAGAASLAVVAGAVVLVFVAVCVGAILHARRWPDFGVEEAWATLELLAISVFNFAVPAVLLLVVADDLPMLLRWLAPLLSLAAAAVLAVGLLVWRRCDTSASIKARLAGCAVAIQGGLAMLGVVGVAWPDPAGMLPVAVIDFLILSAVAYLFRIPAGHGLALLCGLFGYVLGFHLVTGRLGWTCTTEELLAAITHPIGGVSISLPALLMLIGAEVLRRRDRKPSAAVYFLAAIASAGLSLLLTATGGLAVGGDPYWLFPLLAGYALGAFVVGFARRNSLGVWVGWLLLLSAGAQTLGSHAVGPAGWTYGTLGFASAALALARLARRGRGRRFDFFETPTFLVGILVSLVGVLGFYQTAQAADFAAAAIGSAWLAVLWVAVAVRKRSVGAFGFGQVAAAAAAVLAATAWMQDQPWFADAAHPLADPRTWQTAGCSLALLGLAWSLARLTVGPSRGFLSARHDSAGNAEERRFPIEPRLPRLAALLHQSRTVDRFTGVGLIAVLLGLSAFAVVPGIAFELRTGTDLPGTPSLIVSNLAVGAGSWSLLAALVILMLGWYREGRRSVAGFGLLLVIWSACPLLAGTFPESAASALRWTTAGFFLLASLVAMLIHRRVGVPPIRAFDFRIARRLVTCLGAIPSILLTVIPLLAVLNGDAPLGPAEDSFFVHIGPALSYCAPLVAISGLLLFGGFGRVTQPRVLASALLINLGATSAYAFTAIPPGLPIDAIHWLRLLHINVIATSAYVLLWLLEITFGSRQAATFSGGERTWPPVLRALATTSKWVAILLVVPALVHLLVDPAAVSGTPDFEAGSAWGCAALLLAMLTAGWIEFTRAGGPHLPTLAQFAVALAGIASASLVLRYPGTWVAYRTWMGSQTVAAWAMFAVGWWLDRRGRGGSLG